MIVMLCQAFVVVGAILDEVNSFTDEVIQQEVTPTV